MTFPNMTALAGTLALLVMGCAPLAAQSSTPQEQKNKDMVLNWWRDVVVAGHVDAASKYLADDYIEHDPNIPAGTKAGFVEFYRSKPPWASSVKPPSPKAPVISFGKGDYVVLVWEIEDKDAKGTNFKYNNYDVLRIQNGKIQEHWNADKKSDSAPAASAIAAPAPLPTASLKNSPEEQKNEQFVLDMYRDVLQYHHFELASKYMAANYIQHNYTDPQGRDPLMEELAERFKPEPLQPQMKNRPHFVVTKGDIVLMMTSRAVKDPQDASKNYLLNHFEMIRVENGIAQEHWDSSIGPGGLRR